MLFDIITGSSFPWHVCRCALVCATILLQGKILQAEALDPVKMAQHLDAGSPILGKFSNPGTSLTTWMGTLCDSTPIEHIDIPGTHDSSAWNFTGAAAQTIDTQDRPIFVQLNAGIRFLDIRFGLDESTNVLRIYHGDALLSETATLEDILWGLYHFLDTHPSETLLLSLKVDHGSVSVPVQELAHALITASPVNEYWVQSTTLPLNLGASRGKIILFRRFGFDTATNPNLTPVGLDVATGWADNNPDFSIVYSGGHSAYIEDLYQLNGDVNEVSAVQKVEEKFQAIQTHLEYAQRAKNTTQVFITFASGFGAGVGDVLTPKTLALGNSTSHLQGINRKIDEWFVGAKKTDQRLGIILYDFFESPPDLIRRTIGISDEDF